MDTRTPLKRANIIITNRDRYKHLDVCLHYLNLCFADNDQYAVKVYVVDDSAVKTPLNTYDNINVSHLPFSHSDTFNKSRLINHAIARMDDYDWFSLCDVDMVYSKELINRVYSRLRVGVGYVVSHGFKLRQEFSNHVIKDRPNIECFHGNADKDEFKVGPSQVSITKETYQKLIDVYGAPLYSEQYEGWGGEDSDLSSKAMLLQIKHLLLKESVYGVWYHLYHESSNLNQQQYDKNYAHYKERLVNYHRVVDQMYRGISMDKNRPSNMYNESPRRR